MFTTLHFRSKESFWMWGLNIPRRTLGGCSFLHRNSDIWLVPQHNLVFTQVWTIAVQRLHSTFGRNTLRLNVFVWTRVRTKTMAWTFTLRCFFFAFLVSCFSAKSADFYHLGHSAAVPFSSIYSRKPLARPSTIPSGGRHCGLVTLVTSNHLPPPAPHLLKLDSNCIQTLPEQTEMCFLRRLRIVAPGSSTSV